MEISVIIPCYNAAPWIARTIASVLAQTAHSAEIIAVDDGSTDGTAEILASFGDRIRVITQLNRGQGAARNAGARAAQSPWLAFLDADDLYLPDALARYDELHRQFPEATVLFADFEEFDEAGACFPNAPVYLHDLESIAAKSIDRCFLLMPPVEVMILRNGAFTPSCFIVRREVFFKAGTFDETRAIIGVEDLEMYFHLAPHEPLGFMNRVVVRKRRHQTNISKDWALMRAAAEVALDRVELLYQDAHRDLMPIVRRKKMGLLTGWAKADIDAGRPEALRTSMTLVKYAPLSAQSWWLLTRAVLKGVTG
jgi:glycosyltransferase involved in cell wall biosynthesis